MVRLMRNRYNEREFHVHQIEKENKTSNYEIIKTILVNRNVENRIPNLIKMHEDA